MEPNTTFSYSDAKRCNYRTRGKNDTIVQEYETSTIIKPEYKREASEIFWMLRKFHPMPVLKSKKRLAFLFAGLLYVSAVYEEIPDLDWIARALKLKKPKSISTQAIKLLKGYYGSSFYIKPITPEIFIKMIVKKCGIDIDSEKIVDLYREFETVPGIFKGLSFRTISATIVCIFFEKCSNVFNDYSSSKQEVCHHAGISVNTVTNTKNKIIRIMERSKRV